MCTSVGEYVHQRAATHLSTVVFQGLLTAISADPLSCSLVVSQESGQGLYSEFRSHPFCVPLASGFSPTPQISGISSNNPELSFAPPRASKTAVLQSCI